MSSPGQGSGKLSPIDGLHPLMVASGSTSPSTSLQMELFVLVDFVHSADII
jgi:hypothetical protein